jgi:hypothetical protein
MQPLGLLQIRAAQSVTVYRSSWAATPGAVQNCLLSVEHVDPVAAVRQ